MGRYQTIWLLLYWYTTTSVQMTTWARYHGRLVLHLDRELDKHAFHMLYNNKIRYQFIIIGGEGTTFISWISHKYQYNFSGEYVCARLKKIISELTFGIWMMKPIWPQLLFDNGIT